MIRAVLRVENLDVEKNGEERRIAYRVECKRRADPPNTDCDSRHCRPGGSCKVEHDGVKRDGRRKILPRGTKPAVSVWRAGCQKALTVPLQTMMTSRTYWSIRSMIVSIARMAAITIRPAWVIRGNHQAIEPIGDGPGKRRQKDRGHGLGGDHPTKPGARLCQLPRQPANGGTVEPQTARRKPADDLHPSVIFVAQCASHTMAGDVIGGFSQSMHLVISC